MKFELNSLPRNCSQEEMIAEIRRVDSLVRKDKLTKQDYDKFAKMSSSAIGRKFGGWENTLIAAGLGHKYSGIKVSEKMRQQQSKYLTDEEILDELRRIAKKLNQDYITQVDVNNNSGIIAATLIVYRFGSWAEGLKKAGLQKSPRSTIRLSDDELFENVLNAWTHYGRQPSHGEMEKFPSVISPGTYEGRFGSWRKALEAFVTRMNQEEQIDEQILEKENTEKPILQEIKKHSTPVEDRRGIPLGLRYKVLSRDKFKCVRDGRSPATDPTCILHIDHIIPFSKGGRTNLENLQTLCKDCNLGKGNRHSE